MGMDGGGKLPYSYVGHNDAKLVKSFSRVEPRKFGIGLVAGFLLVTCAYFSTAKFDAIHIAMLSPSGENAAGIGSLVNAAAADGSKKQLDLGLQDREALSKEGSKAEVVDNDDGDKVSSSGPDSSRNASLADTRKDETFGGDATVFVASAAAPNPAAVGGEDRVPAKDGDATAVLPPVPSAEPSNSTQESGVLEDEELQVQDAVANATKRNDDSSSSSNGGSHSVIPSDPAVLPAPVEQIPLASSAVRDSGTPVVREWKPLCDVTSNKRIDWCVLDGDVRVLGANGTITLVSSSFREESWRIRPYPRKADPNAMRHITNLTVRSVSVSDALAPACPDHDGGGVPALVFSDRGYSGNYFHAFTDVILPLFLTARPYAGEVRLLVTNFQMWWLGKFMPVFKALSNYDLVDLDQDPRVRCFRHVQVGLTAHGDFSIDPARAPNGYSMLDFTKFMRSVYNLPRDAAFSMIPNKDKEKEKEKEKKKKRPRLLVIARAKTRRFVNTEEIVRGAEKVGFEVVVSEGNHEVAPFAEIANGADAIMGVHGAGLTNMVFMPPGGVVIQVVPLGGLDFVVNYFRGPSRDMGHKYLEYRIKPEESTLIDQFPRDHVIFTDPDGVKSKGWDSLKNAYLDKQHVRLDMKRFRPTLKKAIAHFRKADDGSN
ncbi:hypothetical protein PR202_gb26632 [Eleusine coracana subsp. coracana]|uniref:Glycosyltransferase 61 catalytic domain-containing protein n=1 Tax=Eleusine coracana subsp. coracana TaxID=191504 RepID=A0AAV5FRZ9_ELECO|nr:hypothetical protein PR202_gb26632 [Eleusine coracana subsp. coracana]